MTVPVWLAVVDGLAVELAVILIEADCVMDAGVLVGVGVIDPLGVFDAVPEFVGLYVGVPVFVGMAFVNTRLRITCAAYEPPVPAVPPMYAYAPYVLLAYPSAWKRLMLQLYWRLLPPGLSSVMLAVRYCDACVYLTSTWKVLPEYQLNTPLILYSPKSLTVTIPGPEMRPSVDCDRPFAYVSKRIETKLVIPGRTVPPFTIAPVPTPSEPPRPPHALMPRGSFWSVNVRPSATPGPSCSMSKKNEAAKLSAYTRPGHLQPGEAALAIEFIWCT